MKIQPEDYCALVCREPNKLRLVNCQAAEVVEVVGRCLEAQGLDYELYYKSKVTCAFRLSSHLFIKNGCSERNTIKIKEIFNFILVMSYDSNF